MYVANKSSYNIEYVNKMPIFELLPLLKILKKKDAKR